MIKNHFLSNQYLFNKNFLFKLPFYGFLCALLVLGACKEKSKVQLAEEAKWEAVMANHDVVMPMMGNTNKVRKQLRRALSDKGNLSEPQTLTIQNLISDLDKADEGMMDWMHGFQKLSKLQETKSHEEIMQYLDTEDAKIKAVGEMMTSSIDNGTAFIENLDK